MFCITIFDPPSYRASLPMFKLVPPPPPGLHIYLYCLTQLPTENTHGYGPFYYVWSSHYPPITHSHHQGQYISSYYHVCSLTTSAMSVPHHICHVCSNTTSALSVLSQHLSCLILGLICSLTTLSCLLHHHSIVYVPQNSVMSVPSNICYVCSLKTLRCMFPQNSVMSMSLKL